jgi:hypothetical protein
LVAITSDAIPKPATKQYKPLDDLETKISAQIKQANHLDNVTLHQQYKYQEEKKVPKLLSKINNNAANNNTGRKPHQ